jgi:hypothetical protein
MANIDEQTAQACSLPVNLLPYLRKVDGEKHKDGSFIMIRVVPGGRALWLKDHKSTDDTTCPLDRFDSGVIYFVQPDEKAGSLKGTLVCMSDPYPNVHPVTSSTASVYIKERFAESPKSKSRKWAEGAILRMITMSDGKTLVASRSRINALSSKWTNEPGCPTVEEALNETATSQGVRLEALRVPGTCHVLLLRHPCNQILDVNLEKPQLCHLASYDFESGSYSQAPEGKYDIEGFLKLGTLTDEKATEVVLQGGVVLRENLDGRTEKFMLTSTMETYGWLTKPPVQLAFELLAKNPLDFARFRTVLRGESLRRVDDAMINKTQNERAAAEYIITRNKQTLKKGSKVHPKLEDDGINRAVGHLRYKYAEAKAKAIESGRFKTESKPRKGKKAFKPIFRLGRTPEDTKEAEIAIVMDYLVVLQQKHPSSYYRLIRKCARFAKQEEFFARKARGEVKEDEKEPLEEEEDFNGFIPVQINCDELEEIPSKKWADRCEEEAKQ